MPQKELTQEQKDQFPKYIDKWRQVAICTDPMNKEAATNAIKQVYKDSKFKPPVNFIFTSSPYANAFTAAICRLIIELKPEPTAVNKAWNSYIKAVEGQEDRDQFMQSVRGIIKEQCLHLLIERKQFKSSGNIEHDLNGIAVMITANITKINSAVYEGLQKSGFGNMDAGWLSYYEFFKEVVGLKKETKELEGLFDLAQHAGWFLPFEDTVFIADRPSFINLDDADRLHCTTRGAVEFRDGFKYYSLHDIRVEEAIIRHPEQLTLQRIDEERNAEVRRVLTQLYGVDKWLIDSKAEVLHQDTEVILMDTGAAMKRHRKLLRKEVPNDEAIVRVMVTNHSAEPDGTYRNYFLPVDPELRPLLKDPDDKSTGLNREQLIENGYIGAPQELTCHNAVASTFGLRGEEYKPDVES
jgi:hypothetical protein